MTDHIPPEPDFVAEIARITANVEDLPQPVRTRALNAVGPALQARGEWLRLSSRKAVADAVLAELKRELDALAEYEHTITWMTTCTGCARVLDSAYAETVRAEQAEAALDRVRALIAEHPVTVGTHLLEEALDQGGEAAADRSLSAEKAGE